MHHGTRMTHIQYGRPDLQGHLLFTDYLGPMICVLSVELLSMHVAGSLFPLNSIRMYSHWYEYESGYPCTGSSKHEIAYIPIVAVHIDTSSLRVRVTCEFHSYE